MKFFSLLSALIVVIGCSRAVAAVGLTVKHDLTASSDIPLVVNGRAAAILVDPAEAEVVRIAAGLFAEDVERVTRVKPDVIENATPQETDTPLVLIGTVGQSGPIKELIRRGKLDTAAIEGKWESFLITTVSDPLPGVPSALVIAGSDRRGTAFGVFEVSAAIGVSPWVWWSDVTPRRQETLVFADGTFTQGPPSVKYRGIFLNDEDWGLQPWAAKTFEPETGDLRQKGYTLKPMPN
jgi:hypothetical protein